MREQNTVRINCPSEERWPSFYKAFHGKVGTVVKMYESFAKIDISTDKVAVPYINVDLAWLEHAERSR
jgi:ribosomal protein L21E